MRLSTVSPAPRTSTSPGRAELILVVQENFLNRRVVCHSLEHAGYEVVEAEDCETALALVAQRRPDLIVQDLILPDMDGLELARSLRDQLGEVPVPILCLTGFLSSRDAERTRQGGFAQVLVKPVNPRHLLDMVRLHLAPPIPAEGARGKGRRLLLIDDDPMQRRLSEIGFLNAGFDVIVANDGEAGLEIARKERPAIIVSDVLMPKMDGFALCLAIRRDKELASTPVILSSWAHVEEADHSLATRVGANALLSKADAFDAIARRVVAAIDVPVPPATLDSVELQAGEHIQRALWQLERQVQQNVRLLQRSAEREAQLAVLAGVAEALAKNRPVDGVLRDVLAACLDMAGISKGALYLKEHDVLQLKHQIGFSSSEVAVLTSAFDDEPYLANIATQGAVVLVPSNTEPSALEVQMIARAGVTSLLLVPVSWASTTYGLMVLGAKTADVTGEDAMTFAQVLGTQMGLAIGLGQTFTSLAASEERYRTLTENANDAICILTPDGSICESNRRLTDILGYPAADLVGRHIRDLAVPGREHESMELYSQSLKAGTGRTPPLEIRKADGGTALLEFSNTAVQVAGEQLVLAIGRDVTEQVRAQAQLMASDRMASVGTLAAGVAHEINNPLAAVIANIDFSLEHISDLTQVHGESTATAELRDALSDAREGADRVRQIVRDLKIFSRSEEDHSTSVDIRRVLESTLRMAWNEVRHRATLVKNYGKVPFVRANEARLGQVFLNLVVNAAQAIPEGHADKNEIHIVTSSDARGRVVVEVRDTGAGISPTAMKSLFTPFYTTKPAGVGTGLGLAICQRIVLEIGGEISATSTVGIGTTFTVCLPAAQGDVEARPSVPIPAAAAARRGRVLLVDDDEMMGIAVRRTLSKEHDVTVVTNAKDALALIETGENFDVILCDMMMPVMTGMDFHEHLTATRPDLAGQLVFLTGGAFTVRAREFLDRVPNVRLEKPFEVQNLRGLVNARVR